MSDHPAVTKAYREREYTDANGTLWERGMDGWFDRSRPGWIHIMHHHDMADLIEREATK